MTYLSPEGLKKIKEEFERRKSLRAEISQKIQEAKALGDLSENAEYQEALAVQSFNEGKIMDLGGLLRNAEVVSGAPGHKHEKVEIGSQVRIQSKAGVQQFTIVGSSEVDPTKGFISNESPLGRAFLDHKAGDEVEAETPKGRTAYKILEIL